MSEEKVPLSKPRLTFDVRIRDDQNEIVAHLHVYEFRDVFRVTNVWVDPKHRGKGLVRQLFDRLFDVFGDYEFHLEVDPYVDQPRTVQELIKLYEKFGFVLQDEYGYMTRAGKKIKSMW